ncbi:MAG: hypothetical protein ACTH2W_10960 [Vagococcus sp.]
MMVKEIKEMALQAFKNELGVDAYEAYLDKNEWDESGLDKAIDAISYHSHSGSRDCDRVVITVGKEYDDTNMIKDLHDEWVLTECLEESFEIVDVSEKTYYINIITDLF